jgi:imidazolonepropionase-like amidohydrolase
MLLLSTLALAMLQVAAPSRPFAITHVTVIDGSDPAPRPDQTVVVRDNRMVAVGPASEIRVPAGARVVSGRGKFLIPGLWDMHVHTVTPAGREMLGLYVANGVLGVRDLAGDWDQITRWRADIAAGRLTGPRLMASGPYLEGGDVPIPHLLARNPDEARRAVDSLARLGVDVIKLHSQFNREAYFAAARAARERGLRVAGHVPRSITPSEASDSGVGTIEHMLQIPIPCTAAESLALRPRFPIQRVLGECTSADLAPLFARFVRNGTRVVPTLVAAYEIARWPRRDLPGDRFASFIPDTLRRFVASIFLMPADIPADADAVGRAVFEKRLALVGAMHRAGVGILTGTDAPLRNSPPGFGLHQELALLVRGGMPPFEVLRAATLEPARYFGMTDSLGTIASGNVADLVLLGGNPLSDIGNISRIEAVVVNGRLIGAEARRALLRRYPVTPRSPE